MVLNSNLFKSIRSAQKWIIGYTKNVIKMEQVKVLMNDDYLMFVFQKIQNMANFQLKKSLAKELIVEELEKLKTFWDFDLSDFLEKLSEKIRFIFKLLISEYSFKEILYSLRRSLVEEYVLLIIRFAKDFKLGDSKRLVDKITNDNKLINEHLQNDEIGKEEKIRFIFSMLKKYIETKNIDETIAYFVKMQMWFRKKIKTPLIFELIKAKCFYSSEIQKYILENVKSEQNYKPLRQTQESIQKKNKFTRSVCFFVIIAWFRFSFLKRRKFKKIPK